MFEIEFSAEVEEELGKIRSYERARILDVIEQQLEDRPAEPTKNRKILVSLVPTFTAVPPVWELRVGDYRVFYDVDHGAKKVYIRAIRRKPSHRATREIT